MNAISSWLEDRLSCRSLAVACGGRTLPHGVKFGYALGSTIFWLVVIQAAVGLVMMGTYSPAITSAWASVHYIEQWPGGAFLRAMHYWGAQALIVLSAVYVVYFLALGLYRAPREVTWITALLLCPALVVWAVTGNPLSASQEGMAQIKVEGAILASLPVVGPLAERVLLGGSEPGTLTLTHLFLLHVAVMPLAVGSILLIHLWQLRRFGLEGIRADSLAKHEAAAAGKLTWWPYQSAVNMLLLSTAVMVLAVAALTLGAPLFAPADPSLPHSPRPVWYFRSLYELRHHFPLGWDFVPTVVLPKAVLLFLLALPWIDRCLPRMVSGGLRAVILLGGLAGLGALTWISYDKDRRDEAYQRALQLDDAFAQRARLLADRQEIPPLGAAELLRRDPRVQGPLLYERHCASCHAFTAPEGEVNRYGWDIPAAEPSAPNLYGFGTQAWFEGWLDPQRIQSEDYFGGTAFAQGSEMIDWVKNQFSRARTDEQKAALREKLSKVARALTAEGRYTAMREADERDAALIAEGRQLLVREFACQSCHGYEGALGHAPDLTDYGSREWLMMIIADPEHERFYPLTNDRMPAYAADPHDPQTNLLSPDELSLLVEWLRGDWYDPQTQPDYQPPPAVRQVPVLADLFAPPPPKPPAAEPAEPQPSVTQPPGPPPGEEAVAIPLGPDAVALFDRHCAKCHAHTDAEGRGIAAKGEPSAPNLYGIGGFEWHRGWLYPELIKSADFYGNTFFADGEMVEWVEEVWKRADTDEKQALLREEMDKIARALVAEARLPRYAEADARDQQIIEEGRQLLVEKHRCTDCHKYHEEGDHYGPDLTDYGSREWLRDFIANPEHERFYPHTNDRMPIFMRNPNQPERNLLTAEELDALVRWLRQEPPAAAGQE